MIAETVRRWMARPGLPGSPAEAVAALLLLGGCGAAPVSEELRSGYASARDALEAGDYPDAVRRYEDLRATAGGDVGVAIRLDYAHALLRAGEPERALAMAHEVEALEPGFAGIGHAKLVAAIAKHELAERALVRGAPYEEARARARDAYGSLDRVLRSYPQYDPEGVLIARMRKLRETLAELEIEQLRAELEAGANRLASERAAYILREFADAAAVADARALLGRARPAEE